MEWQKMKKGKLTVLSKKQKKMNIEMWQSGERQRNPHYPIIYEWRKETYFYETNERHKSNQSHSTFRVTVKMVIIN